MKTHTKHHWLLKFLLLLSAVAVFSAQLVFADHYRNSDAEALKDYMKDKQEQIEETYDDLDVRVRDMDYRDPKKKCLEDGCPDFGIPKALLDIAKSAKNDFKDLNVDDDDSLVVLSGGIWYTTDIFDDAERKALTAIKEVQKFIISPLRPADVPEGDIITDFIPQFIRLLFRFASLAVLISFVASGVFMIISFDNEERVTKAKHMLMYTFVGFAFVTLAFALVKALTDIDFFNFV